MSRKTEAFIQGPDCPYCGGESHLADSTRIYSGVSYGPIYLCDGYPRCDAYVGCHKGTTKPLGRLADAELRRAKKAAHAVFDRLWKYKDKGARSRAYEWLAEKLGISVEDCHIGMFDIQQCRSVVAACRELLNEI